MSEKPYSQKSSITIDGLTWETCNVGATNCSGWGKLFTYDMALHACPDGWRMPTCDEIETIMSLFTHFGEYGEYADYRIRGLFFSGSSPEGDSVFLPCAGYNYGDGHKGSQEYGCYWLSTGDYFVFCCSSLGGSADPLRGMHSGQYRFLAPEGICAFSVRCVKN